MTVSDIASSSGSNGAAAQSQLQQTKANFANLAQSLRSGDLAGAKQDFAALQRNAPQGQDNPLQQQMDALGQALQSGNLAGAQQAFSALHSTARARGGHRGHGGSGGASSGSGSSGSSSSSKTIVSEISTTSATGFITTVITYLDGSTKTTTSYGPAAGSSHSVTV